MIFGDRNQFAFEIEPLEPSWERRGLADGGPWARLSIYFMGRCLTRAIDETTSGVLSSVNVPLAPLASWLTENIRAIMYEESCAFFRKDVKLHEALSDWNNQDPPSGHQEEEWEDERYRWYCRHFWLSGSEGCMVPDLAFVRADERLWVSWSKPHFAGPRPLEFVEAAGWGFVDWDCAWGVFDDFVAYVAAEVQKVGPAPKWSLEERPLQKASCCLAEEFVSFLSPLAKDLLVRLKIDRRENPEGSVALQALRDFELSDAAVDETSQALKALEEITEKEGGASTLEALRREVPSARQITLEKAGYDAAKWMRARYDLNGDPLLDIEAFFEREFEGTLAVEEADGRSDRNHCAVGMKRDRGAGIFLLRNVRTQREWARRMEYARAIGHLLLDPFTREGVFGAGSSQTAQGPRRRRSGAFAAELLLPESGIRSFLEGKDPSNEAVFADIMERFGVGARTAAYHLRNKGLLKSDEDRDGLIETHGSRESGG